MSKNLEWYKVANIKDYQEGRVKTVTAGTKTIALSLFEGKFCAIDNHCPHQGGPLGEGSIEEGWLRCPWHGYEYHPCTGKPPEGLDDTVPTYEVKIENDDIYVGVEEEKPHKRNVSDIMVETMINWGVDSVFGMVGHSNLGLADAIRRQTENGKLKYYGIRHEGAASFAASGYAKLTGKPAACFGIAGPGSTNMLTGLWDAKVDRVPILALSGQVDTQVLGPGAFQEVDLASAFQSVAEWSQTVLPQSKHTELMTLALKNAILKRDIAHLIFPNEVQEIEVDENTEASSPEGRLTDLQISPPKESLEKAIAKIKEAERPCIIVGNGAKFSMEAIIKFAEKIEAPVITTFKGKGLIPDDHPLACGVLGRSGTPIASYFMNASDLIIVFGASFSNHTGIATFRPIIQVDFDQMALGKFHKVDIPVWGEIGVTVNLLNNKFTDHSGDESIRKEIAGRWNMWREEKSKRTKDDKGKGLNSAFIFETMSKLVPDDAVITVDVGNNAYSFGRYFECKRQSILMSGYLGSIGFGYPAAMGAYAAAPNRKIVAVTGDGGFAQYMAELTTAVKYNMNITHILLNNDELGKITKEQKADELKVWETNLVNPNFAEYANNCGAMGIRITKKEELEEAMKKALDHNGPAMVEIIADSELI
jgi:thiamine pyrophosphate-dependent acetolactate synthase large subunit-like protein/nitrite reductase/ring-hydroxylating ferredoxin subunit